MLPGTLFANGAGTMGNTPDRGARVAVLGGGMAGLASAHYAANAGYAVTLLDPGPCLGRDPGRLELCSGQHVERVPLRLDSGDTALCGLLADLGLLGRVSWHPTSSNALIDGQPQKIGSARDVLRQSRLGLARRMRAALGVAYSADLKNYALELDEVAASAWLPRVFGRHVYESTWRPMLERRFADLVDEVSAYWAWRLLHRMRSGAREVRGQIQGGAQVLYDRLRSSVEQRGGEMHLHADVTAVEADGKRVLLEVDGTSRCFDALISTVTPEQLRKLARGALPARLPAESPEHLGRVTALVVARRPVTSSFETIAVGEHDEPFQTVFEPTNVVTGQRPTPALVYASYVCAAHTDAYRLSDDVIRKQAVEFLARSFPGFGPEHVEQVEITRQTEVEPVHTVGALARRPAPRIPETGILLCSSAQIHPRTPGWDAEVSLARETCGLLEVL